MNALWKLAFLASVVPITAACSLLEPRREIALYAPGLSAATRPASPTARSWTVEVVEPYALSPLSGTAIVVSPHPGELAVYGGARWHETPPLMLQALLVEALRDAGIPNAGRGDSLSRADYALESDLRAFAADAHGDGAPTVAVRLDARLVRLSDGRTLGVREFSVAEPAAAPAIASVAGAFERAVERLTRDAADWACLTLAADPPSR